MDGSRIAAFLFLLVAGQQQPAPQPSGLIVGQVVDAGTGAPVAGVIVTISPPPPPQARFVDPRVEPPPPPPRILTGTDGRFLFRDLPRGSYSITAIRNGYAEGAFARRRPAGPSRSVTLAEGERLGDVTIRMWRHGAITGTVVDEAGEPAIGLMVRAWRSTVIAGRRRFAGAGSAITDDRGIYRIGNLVPGDYLVVAPIRSVAMPLDVVREGTAGPNALASSNASVSAALPGAPAIMQVRDTALVLNSGAVPAIANDGRLYVYPTTYYPSATAAHQATPVTVASGEERSAIDFQLRPLPTAAVSGTLLGPDGPRSATQVRLSPADTDELIGDQEALTTTTRSTGAFTFPAVPVGHYVLRLQIRPPNPGAPPLRTGDGRIGYPLLWAELPVSVGRSDITGLDVTLRPGFRISGSVEFEGIASRPSPMALTQVPVAVEPAEGSSVAPSPSAFLTANGQFSTAGHAPGRYLLRIGNSPTGWMFKSAMLGGRDIADSPFDLTEDVSGVVITFTNRWTGVEGTVRTRQGAPDPDATVVIFPVNSDAWTSYGVNPRRLKSARATSAGTYTINSVPPGEYFVAALSEEQSADWQDPTFLAALSRAAARVTVYEGEKATQDVVTREGR